MYAYLPVQSTSPITIFMPSQVEVLKVHIYGNGHHQLCGQVRVHHQAVQTAAVPLIAVVTIIYASSGGSLELP